MSNPIPVRAKIGSKITQESPSGVLVGTAVLTIDSVIRKWQNLRSVETKFFVSKGDLLNQDKFLKDFKCQMGNPDLNEFDAQREYFNFITPLYTV